MKSPLNIEFADWLAAERDGREVDAEAALAGVFTALPGLAPTVGFVDRVMAGAGFIRPPMMESRWFRGAIAAVLLLVGLAMAWILPAVLGLTRLITPGELASLAVQGFVAVISRIDELLALWQVWTRIASTAMLVATSPPVVLSLLALTALSAFTFRGLSELLSPQRSPDYV